MCFQGDLYKVAAISKRPKYKVKSCDDKQVTKAIDAFLNTDVKRARFGNYFIDGNALVYRAMVTNTARHMGAIEIEALIASMDAGRTVACNVTRSELAGMIDTPSGVSHYARDIVVKTLSENVIALKLKNNLIIGNSSAIGLIGRRVSFGRARDNRDVTEVQTELARHIPMLPFSVFAQADLDINTLIVKDQGGAETVTRLFDTGKWTKDTKAKPSEKIYKLEKVHFTGASLFQVADALFLFDIDRREIELKIFNPFLVKLPMQVNTIAAAYAALKPKAVSDAEYVGLKVLRQGEWFFIPVDKSLSDRLDGYAAEKNGKESRYVKRITLQAGPNRPNYADGLHLYNGAPLDQSTARGMNRSDEVTARSECYVTRKVEHSGREHAPLTLKGWYRAVPNTATESFTITGDID